MQYNIIKRRGCNVMFSTAKTVVDCNYIIKRHGCVAWYGSMLIVEGHAMCRFICATTCICYLLIKALQIELSKKNVDKGK